MNPTKTLIAIAIASILAVSLSATAVAAPAAARSSWSPTASMPSGTAIRAGYAPIDQALAILVPAPYRILVDRSVPRTAVLTWRNGNDWMSVLRDALRPMGLQVRPDWSTNTLEIYPSARMAEEPTPAPESSAAYAAAMEPGVVTHGLAASHAAAPSVMPAAVSSASAPAAVAMTKPLSASPLQVAPPAPIHVPPIHVAPAHRADTIAGEVYVKGGNNAKPVRVASLVAGPLKGSSADASYAWPDSAKAHAPKPKFDGAMVLQPGEMLSVAITHYAARFGWDVSWQYPVDYRLTAPFPIPKGSIEHGILYIVRVFQRQNGLLGAAPRFYDDPPNRYVVIESSTTAQAGQQESP